MKTFKVTGMTCEGCAKTVHDLLSRVEGVSKVHVDLLKKQADVKTGKQVSIRQLHAALGDTVYELLPIKEKPFPNTDTDLTREEKLHRENKALVSDYITAVAENNYMQLEECLHQDFVFNNIITFHSAKDFIRMLKEHAASGVTDMVIKNDIKAIFADGNKAEVIYDMITDTPVKRVRFLQEIKIENRKILSAKAKFEKHSMKQLMKYMKEHSAL
jgi:copper chaperone CopZ